MSLISDSYRSLNKQLHEDRPDYGIQGKEMIPYVSDLIQTFNTSDLLDYGCGKSTLSMHLPFKIQQYDPAIPRFSELPKPADIVVCTDVLEHIEPECLDDVLDHIKDLTKTVFYCTIHTKAAKKLLPDGRNAHLIIEPPPFWFSKIEERLEIVSYSRGVKHVMITAIPRTRD